VPVPQGGWGLGKAGEKVEESLVSAVEQAGESELEQGLVRKVEQGSGWAGEGDVEEAARP
jgi:hypothetical protein